LRRHAKLINRELIDLRGDRDPPEFLSGEDLRKEEGEEERKSNY